MLAGAGFAWAAAWVFWSRDYPEKPSLPEESGLRSEVSVSQVIRSPAMVMAMAQYFASNFTFFISLSWMFPYLRQHYATPPIAGRYIGDAPTIIWRLFPVGCGVHGGHSLP